LITQRVWFAAELFSGEPLRPVKYALDAGPTTLVTLPPSAEGFMYVDAAR